MHERRMTVPLDDPLQVAAWNERASDQMITRLAGAAALLLQGATTIARRNGIDIEAEAAANPKSPFAIARDVLTDYVRTIQ